MTIRYIYMHIHVHVRDTHVILIYKYTCSVAQCYHLYMLCSHTLTGGGVASRGAIYGINEGGVH